MQLCRPDFSMSAPSRYEPCDILREVVIPFLVYFEDAIAAYGVPMTLFDLHLVSDLATAADALAAAGWTTAPPFDRDYHFLNSSTCMPHRRLVPPAQIDPLPSSPGLATTVLLPADSWGVPDADILSRASAEGMIPLLSLLLDGLIKSLLDLPSFDSPLYDHLATQISYLYAHCDALKDQGFADRLVLEHRQFHYDALSKPGLGTVPFVGEQRQIRDDIRGGRREPRRSSWYLSPPARHV
ncbi:hypothetical protein N658DRAFT_221212 [Parathielavia hyrcaniae]|uniref:Uncharacterized protein n=1 Tax=Parathielavia hyrcaniae TaxID=113614 RepID=A0AAN6PV63_9PEZI|nr:hypothetical protein N658DRAFT_221212 [Parathielavia hyrcaniae]